MVFWAPTYLVLYLECEWRSSAPPSTVPMARWNSSSCCAPYPSVYGYAFQLLHFAEVRPASNTGLLCHFPAKTLQKVQELGQMGYVDHSTPPHGRILLF